MFLLCGFRQLYSVFIFFRQLRRQPETAASAQRTYFRRRSYCAAMFRCPYLRRFVRTFFRVFFDMNVCRDNSSFTITEFRYNIELYHFQSFSTYFFIVWPRVSLHILFSSSFCSRKDCRCCGLPPSFTARAAHAAPLQFFTPDMSFAATQALKPLFCYFAFPSRQRLSPADRLYAIFAAFRFRARIFASPSGR